MIIGGVIQLGGQAVELLGAISNKYFMHTLDLDGNKIGTEGAKRLSGLLRQAFALISLPR